MYTYPLETISMKFRDYIERNHAFTVDQLAVSCELAPVSVKTTLKRAIEAGQIERVRRGAYVSKIGRYSDAVIDSFELVSALDCKAVFSFHSALEVFGVAHNVSSICQFRSDSVRTPFTYSGVRYRPYPSIPGIQMQSVRSWAGLYILTTSKEQTIVDCLEHPDRAGGLEEVLMSVSLFSYVDAESLARMVSGKSASIAARVGWLLEQKQRDWNVSPETLSSLESMASGGPFRLDKDSRHSNGWSSRWQLCLPELEEEIIGWIACDVQ